MLRRALESAGVEFIEENGGGGRSEAEETMKIGVRPVERAFQLAQSGSVQNVAEIKRAMLREGYATGEIEGEQLRTQLRALIKAARGSVKPEP